MEKGRGRIEGRPRMNREEEKKGRIGSKRRGSGRRGKKWVERRGKDNDDQNGWKERKKIEYKIVTEQKSKAN